MKINIISCLKTIVFVKKHFIVISSIKCKVCEVCSLIFLIHVTDDHVLKDSILIFQGQLFHITETENILKKFV